MAPGGERSIGRRVAELAAAHPHAVALVGATAAGGERTVTWEDLEVGTRRLARLFSARGAGRGALVAIALANSPEHLLCSLAAWKLGACVLPLDPRLPERERAGLLALARPVVTITQAGDEREALPLAEALELAACEPAAPLPDRLPHPAKAIASGGSTGRPKLIVDLTAWSWASPLEEASQVGMRPGQRQLVAAPLYHNLAFLRAAWGMFEGQRLVIMERFDAGRAAELIERHAIQFLPVVPTMMHRLARLPDIDRRDLSSVQALWHTGGSCPPAVKRAWIDRLGPTRVHEGYGSTEDVGGTEIRGDEWLKRRGSVGRPVGCDLQVRGDDGATLAPGEVGELHFRPAAGYLSFAYLGAPPPAVDAAGFVATGDLGHVDDDGYLYLSDRRTDLIVSGGVNVAPAEVEGVLLAHPAVSDAVVVGKPDDEWGQRVHAVVEPTDPAAPPGLEDLRRHCRATLAAPKVPRSLEIVARLPRAETGKVRRAALR